MTWLSNELGWRAYKRGYVYSLFTTGVLCRRLYAFTGPGLARHKRVVPYAPLAITGVSRGQALKQA